MGIATNVPTTLASPGGSILLLFANMKTKPIITNIL